MSTRSLTNLTVGFSLLIAACGGREAGIPLPDDERVVCTQCSSIPTPNPPNPAPVPEARTNAPGDQQAHDPQAQPTQPAPPGLFTACTAIANGPPTLIHTAAELQAIGKESKGGNFKLAGDIDLTGIAFTPLTLSNGSFDGAGHTIKNLTVTSTGYDYNGLFQTTSCAVIRDVKLTGARINLATTPGGSSCSGVIVGIATDTNVEGVTIATSAVSGHAGYSAGGVIGCAYGRVNVGALDADIAIDHPASFNQGGILGEVSGANVVVKDTVFRGSITAARCVGGIVGTSGGGGTSASNMSVAGLEISNTKMIGSVVAKEADPAGIVGCSLLSTTSISEATVTGSVTGTGGGGGIIAHSYEPPGAPVPALKGNTSPSGLPEVLRRETSWR